MAEQVRTELTEAEREAIRSEGASAGKSAASWVFDGNTSQETYAAYIRMSNDGDPALYDTFDAGNPLSGEWADGPTVRTLIEDHTEVGTFTEDVLTDEDNDILSALEDEVASIYEEAYSDALYSELDRVALLQTADVSE